MISEVLSSAGRWRALLVVLPLGCAAAALGVHPPVTQWTASATVLTAPSGTSRTGAQYVNDLQAVLRSDAVTAQVATQTGASAADLRGGLSSRLLASGSSLIEVSYTSADRARADAVPAAAARAGLQSLVDPQWVAAQSQLTTTENDYTRAGAARDAFTGSIGQALPEQAYQSALTEVAQLRTSAATLRATERPGADLLDAQAAARQAQVDALAPQVVTYRALQADVDRTFSALSTVRTAVTTLQSQRAALASPASVTTAPATASSSRLELRTAVTAAAVGLVVAFLLLTALWLARRRGQGEAADVLRQVPGQAFRPRVEAAARQRVDRPVR